MYAASKQQRYRIRHESTRDVEMYVMKAMNNYFRAKSPGSVVTPLLVHEDTKISSRLLAHHVLELPWITANQAKR